MQCILRWFSCLILWDYLPFFLGSVQFPFLQWAQAPLQGDFLRFFRKLRKAKAARQPQRSSTTRVAVFIRMFQSMPLTALPPWL